MTLRELIRAALEHGELDEQVRVRVVRRNIAGAVVDHQRVDIARVSHFEYGKCLVVEWAELDGAEVERV
jgi:hypothetical protein